MRFTQITMTVGILSFVLLTGCASTEKAEPQVVDPTTAAPMDALKRIAIEIRDEKRLRAKAEAAKAESMRRADRTYPPVAIPAGFEKLVTMRYRSTLDKSVQLVATAAGYNFSKAEIGLKPALAIYTRLELSNQPLYEGLLDLGRQAGSSATIKVDERTRTITIVYPPTVNGSDIIQSAGK